MPPARSAATPSAADDVSSRPRFGWPRLRRIGLIFLTLVLIEYLAVPQVVQARSDLTLLGGASPWLLGMAFALEVCSLTSYTALTRRVLPPNARPTFVDQFRIDLTGLGASHVIPGGGASAAALRFRLMTSWGVPPQAAASTAAVQTALAVIGLIATFAGGVVLAGPDILTDPGYAAAGAAATLALVSIALFMRRAATRPAPHPGSARPSARSPTSFGALGQRLSQELVRVTTSVVATAQATATRASVLIRDPDQRGPLFGAALGNWLFDAASLWVCLAAYKVELHPGVLLMAYGAANLIGLLPLTPGGLGVVEGVLIPAVTALGGVSLAPVTLGVLTWRLFEFWLPIPVSGIAYLSLKLQRRLSEPPHHHPAHPEHQGDP